MWNHMRLSLVWFFSFLCHVMSAYSDSTAERKLCLLRMCLLEGNDCSCLTYLQWCPWAFFWISWHRESVLDWNSPQPGYNFLHLENTHVISPNSKMQADQEEFPSTWRLPSLSGRTPPLGCCSYLKAVALAAAGEAFLVSLMLWLWFSLVKESAFTKPYSTTHCEVVEYRLGTACSSRQGVPAGLSWIPIPGVM